MLVCQQMKNVKLNGKHGDGKYTLVDDEDFAMVSTMKWVVNNWGYVVASGNILLHRLVMDAPKDVEVDHINRNKLDNRKTNLRFANRPTQGRNLPVQGHSRFPGVYYDKANSKWVSQIRSDGRRRTLGRFVDEKDAARAYRAEALKLDPLLRFEVWDELDFKEGSQTIITNYFIEGNNNIIVVSK